MNDHDLSEMPISDEEMALARKGEALIKAEVARVEAPQSLRERIEAERARAAGRARAPFWRRHRVAVLGTGAAALALVVAGVAIQAGGGGGEPSLTEVDAVATLPPTETAPVSRGGNPPVLDASVGAIEFPDWEQKFGVKAVGQRADDVSGRSVTTVTYRDADGARLGYSVVAGASLDQSPAGREVVRDGNSYHVSQAGGETVVTWTQQGHTCVIASSDEVPSGLLVELAASRNV
jgi:hypothetical protein